MPVLKDNSRSRKDKDITQKDRLANGKALLFVDNDTKNLRAIQAGSTADDDADTHAENGTSNDHYLEDLTDERFWEEVWHDEKKEGKGEHCHKELHHKGFADKAIGQVDEGQIITEKKEGKKVVSKSARCDHGKTDSAAVNQVIWQKEYFDSKSRNK